ncbi:MAG: DUF222 domain-containing protein [Planctomycetota bacterium]
MRGKPRGEVACYLSAMEERHFYRTFGFASITRLAEHDLGLSPRQTRDRIRLARAIESLPKLKKLFRRGKLHFSAVRAIVSVATPATEADWIKAALQHSMRDLERLVAGSEDGKVPRVRVSGGPNLGLPRNRVHYKLAAEPEEAALIDVVCQREADAKGEPADLMRLFMKVMRHLYVSQTDHVSRQDPRRSPRVSTPDSGPTVLGGHRRTGTSERPTVPRDHGGIVERRDPRGTMLAEMLEHPRTPGAAWQTLAPRPRGERRLGGAGRLRQNAGGVADRRAGIPWWSSSSEAQGRGRPRPWLRSRDGSARPPPRLDVFSSLDAELDDVGEAAALAVKSFPHMQSL